ncbi:putative aldo-keto reductase 1 [Vitis vinifera]|uniref:Putative aldo-keto reductase 1 n=1 Tax=Vitis vinifera TaxID=29760 RepID=A0A438IH51_VITVI|nr:putative aldo-keto reductase 1 [Vitis vinifera]
MAELQMVGVLLPRVKLGNQGLEVSKLGFGCRGLSGGYNNPVPGDVAIAIIKHAFSKGITFFDTADAYGAQANEVLIGKVTTISHGFIRTPLTSLD